MVDGTGPVEAGVPDAGLTRGTTFLMAVACGLTVANIYYNQPLIGIMTRDFGGSALVGFVPTATQVGYGLGILALVPLGDRLNRRNLIVTQSLVLAVALLAAATAPSAAVLLGACVALGVTSTVPQQIIPLAADLSDPARRGSVIGTVMSGLLCGILLARTVAGYVGESFGWRAVFWVGIMLSLGTAAALAAVLPSRPPATQLSYRRLLASTAALVREEPWLRLAAGTQACLFASLSVFWTVLALHLERPPFGYGADVAGLFGLIGAAGALAAPLAGRLADRHGPRLGVGIGIGLSLLSWIVFWAVPSLGGLILGVLALDMGAQGAMIGNQHIVFALRPEARNRVNTIYMAALFMGGALGSAAAMVAWRHGGWSAVCLLGFALSALALLIHGLGARRTSREARAVPSQA